MRILFTTPTGLGHVHSMLPLARAGVQAGHDVVFAGSPSDRDEIERASVPFVPAGRDLPPPAELRRAHPEWHGLSSDELGVQMFGARFGDLAAPAMLADLLTLVRDWPPHVVVADAAEFAGHIVAAELGVPSATKAFGAAIPASRMISAVSAVAPLWRSRGLTSRPHGGCFEALYLDGFPPLLQPSLPDHIGPRHLVRPEAAPATAEAPVSLPAGRGPLVYVTMGTLFNDPAPMHMVLEALDELGLRALVTVGPTAGVTAVGPQSDRVLVERYVPQALVLPHVDMVVCHAGSGTLLAALAAARPVVCLPQGADQFLNAAAVAAGGAGIPVVPHELSVPSVREAIARVLEDPSFGERARDVAASIAGMPAPADAIVALERLAAPAS